MPGPGCGLDCFEVLARCTGMNLYHAISGLGNCLICLFIEIRTYLVLALNHLTWHTISESTQSLCFRDSIQTGHFPYLLEQSFITV